MFPVGYPDTHKARTISYRHVVRWRGYSWSNLLHFVASRPLDADDTSIVWDGFRAWFNTGVWPIGRPSGYLPWNAPAGEILLLEVVAHAGFPVLSARYSAILELEGEDAVVPTHAASIMLRWETGHAGHAGRGRVFLGPISHRLFSSEGVGLMTVEAQESLSLTWSSLVATAPTWFDAGTNFKLAVLHKYAIPGSDDPEGWYNYVSYGYVPDRKIRSLNRRTPQVNPGFAL